MASSEAAKRANRKYYHTKRKQQIAAERASPDWVPMYSRPNIKANQQRYLKSDKGRKVFRDASAKYRTTPKGFARQMLMNAKTNSKRYGRPPPTITRDWILEELKKGCRVTGLPFVLDGPPRHPLAPSLDRIDCSGSYTPDNTRVVLWACNLGIGTWGLDEYLRIAKVALDFSSV